MNAILEINNLVKTFKEVRAVNGVSFSVPQGQCFGLLGPNGAGKTTTIEMMEGIIKPTSGTIRFNGQPITRHFYQHIGIQFQHTAIQDHLTVRETLNLFASLYEYALPATELIELCALHDYVDRDTRKLSGGQRQRLLLALALINDPTLVFLDEPTTGLDPQARRNFWELVNRIKAANKTIILTTHYMDEAEYLCDQIAIMDHGKIIEQGAPETLLHRHFEGVMVRLPESAVEHLEQLPEQTYRRNGTVEFTTRRVDETIQQLLQHKVSMDGLQVRSPNLDDLFLKLTGHELRS